MFEFTWHPLVIPYIPLLLSYLVALIPALVLAKVFSHIVLHQTSDPWRFPGLMTETWNAQRWDSYLRAVLSFNFLACIWIVFILYIPSVNTTPLRWDEKINLAISFVSGTNWQAVDPESIAPWMHWIAFVPAQFIAPVTAICAAIALIRSFFLRDADRLGNFWFDAVRVFYVLLGTSFVLQIILNVLGTPQAVPIHVEAQGWSGWLHPFAAQEAIKMLGNNGGGLTEANAAHIFENPNSATNLVLTATMLIIPAALLLCFGQVMGNRRHSRRLLIIYALGLAFMFGLTYFFDYKDAAGNITWQFGKETRFSLAESLTFITVSNATSTGASSIDIGSLQPLALMVQLVLHTLGGVLFGAAGSGFYTTILYMILTCLIAGLMIGRTPEYFGKKISGREVKCAVFATLVSPLTTLVFTMIVLVFDLYTPVNQGPHKLTEILYTFTTVATNNGSTIASGITNTPFLNILTTLAMALGRWGHMVFVLAIAGSLMAKPRLPNSFGTMPVNSFIFLGLYVSIIIFVAGLIFLPLLCVGPIVSHLQLAQGVVH